jgi:hypothetical protein
MGLLRFSNWSRAEPILSSGFFLKKKPHCTMPETPHKLENRRKGKVYTVVLAGLAYVACHRDPARESQVGEIVQGISSSANAR